jgi:hypothetical protein
MGGNLSIHHPVPLFVWRTIIGPSIVPKNFVADRVTRSLDCISWRALSGFDHPSDFNEN